VKARRRSTLDDSAEVNFWPSFTDLTSTVALILFVLVLLAYLQNLLSTQSLERARSELQQTLTQLRGSQHQVTAAKNQLRLLAAEIEAGQERLRLSEQQVDDQQEVIATSQRELEQVRARVQGIGLLRLSVLQKVKHALETELESKGRGPAAKVAENGNIVLDESLLFEYKSHTIKPEGKVFLDTIARAFQTVLADPQAREHIDVIVVQGHTDTRGPAEYNRELSSKRANTVLSYLFQAAPELENKYGSFFAASAYSEYRPINPGETEEAYRQNRRIEISVVLKDTGVRDVIDEYLEGINAAMPSAAPDAQPVSPSAP